MSNCADSFGFVCPDFGIPVLDIFFFFEILILLVKTADSEVYGLSTVTCELSLKRNVAFDIFFFFIIKRCMHH